MAKWIRNYKGLKECKEYMVITNVLMDELDGYCLGEYEIQIKSWHEDFYNKRYKTADSFSEHRYQMTFKDRNEANRMWKWIVENEPNYEQLQAAGFRHSTW